MGVLKASARFTYEDYVLFPDDGKRHEIIEGEHYMTPAPVPRHQIVLSNLNRILDTFVRQEKLGRVLFSPIDVVFSDENVVQPDLLFVSSERLGIIGEKNLHGAPSLVIEVLSDASRKNDEIIKRNLYERFGVEEYWIVDSLLERVRIYRLTEKGFARAEEVSREAEESFSTSLFPGLTISLSEVFE